jgi:hypothetical protein
VHTRKRNVEDELKFAIRSQKLLSLARKNPDLKKFTVKFGTSVSRHSGKCRMSFSIWAPNSMETSTPACHHTVDVVNGHESNEMYKSSFKNVFNSINSLSTARVILLDDEEITQKIYMGGDYINIYARSWECLAQLPIMHASTAKFTKIIGGDMTKDENYYYQESEDH